MTEHVKLEAGGATEVRFKGKSFFLFVPGADEPFEGDRTRSQADSHLGVIEPVRREAEAGLEKSNAQPMRIKDAAFAGTGGFNPAQGRRSLAAIVAGKVKKPRPQQNRCTDRVDEHQASHRTSICEYYDLRRKYRNRFLQRFEEWS